MCNSPLIKEVVDISKESKCYIYNEQFFKKNYTKLEIQNILLNRDIKIPKIYEKIENAETNLPVFCKENIHAGIVFKAYTKNTLNRFFQKFSYKDFYIEESIECQDEVKCYYIKGNVYCKEMDKLDDKIKDECKKIASALELEVFSVDFINDNYENIVIDVNPSAGFYLLDEARNKFICELKKEMEEK